MMNMVTASKLYCGFGGIMKNKGPRPGVLESHMGNVQSAAGSLRQLGHTVTGVVHSIKTPAGYAKSTIQHKLGKNKFFTHVRTKFNSEGGEHDKQVITEPDTSSKKNDASKDDASE